MNNEMLNKLDFEYAKYFCRYLIMAWGTNKFFKKLIKPNAIPNNELADFISRVPDNEELVSFQNYTHFSGRINGVE